MSQVKESSSHSLKLKSRNSGKRGGSSKERANAISKEAIVASDENVSGMETEDPEESDIHHHGDKQVTQSSSSSSSKVTTTPTTSTSSSTSKKQINIMEAFENQKNSEEHSFSQFKESLKNDPVFVQDIIENWLNNQTEYNVSLKSDAGNNISVNPKKTLSEILLNEEFSQKVATTFNDIQYISNAKSRSNATNTMWTRMTEDAAKMAGKTNSRVLVIKCGLPEIQIFDTSGLLFNLMKEGGGILEMVMMMNALKAPQRKLNPKQFKIPVSSVHKQIMENMIIQSSFQQPSKVFDQMCADHNDALAQIFEDTEDNNINSVYGLKQKMRLMVEPENSRNDKISKGFLELSSQLNTMREQIKKGANKKSTADSQDDSNVTAPTEPSATTTATSDEHNSDSPVIVLCDDDLPDFNNDGEMIDKSSEYGGDTGTVIEEEFFVEECDDTDSEEEKKFQARMNNLKNPHPPARKCPPGSKSSNLTQHDDDDSSSSDDDDDYDDDDDEDDGAFSLYDSDSSSDSDSDDSSSSESEAVAMKRNKGKPSKVVLSSGKSIDMSSLSKKEMRELIQLKHATEAKKKHPEVKNKEKKNKDKKRHEKSPKHHHPESHLKQVKDRKDKHEDKKRKVSFGIDNKISKPKKRKHT